MRPAVRLERGTYIGGPDASRIAGIFPYGAGPADSYAAIVHKTKTPMSPVMLRGLLMEPGLAEWVSQQRGRRMERDVFLVDDEVPFFAGTLDGIEEGGEVLHEFTTTTINSKHMWGVPGTDDCAQHKWAQVQWYMGLDERLQEAHVTCFLVDDDEEPLRYVVPRNNTAIAELRERAEAFWYDHILARVPPLGGVHGVDSSNALNACFPRAGGPILDASAEVIATAEQYEFFRAVEKTAAANKAVHATRLKSILREHEGARWKGGAVHWKERAIGTKVNWEQVAHEVALKAGVSGMVFNGIVREQTFEAKSVRSLRVAITGMRAEPIIPPNAQQPAPPSAPQDTTTEEISP